MTIAATATSQQYVRNGTTTQWSYPNKIFSAADLTVIDLDTSTPPVTTLLVLGTDYTVQNVDVDSGCTITTTVAGVAGHTLDVRSNVSLVQTTSIKNQGSFLPELHEEFFDRITREMQDLRRLAYTFGIHGPDMEAVTWTALPIAASRRNAQLIFDANGLPALGTLSSQALTQTSVGLVLYPQTASEISAGVTPTNYWYPAGNVLRYGTNTVPGTTDMTPAFKSALASNQEIYIPDGTYSLSNVANLPLQLQQNTVMVGANRATVILNNTTSTMTFQYLSPTTGDTAPFLGMRFENFQLHAKNGIQLNQQGTVAHYGSLFGSFPSDNFVTESSLLSPVFRHVSLYGTYNSAGDANSDTNLYPTSGTTTPPAFNTNPADLIAFGCGLFLVKVFDAVIEQSCYFTGFGIANFLDGCDINNIGGRFQNNARHVHIYAHDTYGFSNKIEGRDILANRRRGGIFIDGTEGTIIQNNYFETFLSLVSTPTKDPCGTYITTVADQNTKIIGNRADQNRIGTTAGSPEFDLLPRYGCIISQNDATYDSVNPGVQVQIRETYWTPSSSSSVGATGTQIFLAKFSGNSSALPPPVWLSAESLAFPVCPHVEYDFNNPRIFNTQNPKGLANTGAASWPYKISASNSRVCINTANIPLNISFLCTPEDLDLLIRFQGRWISGGGFVAITWGGVTVFSANVGFASGAPAQQDITIRRPDAQQGIQPIVIQLADATVEYEAIEFIPVNFQLVGAIPAGALSTYRVGDRSVNKNATVGQPKAWVCTVQGAPGTQTSEGNL